MRLLVEGELPSLWGLVGLGADELRWPRPVFPCDVLSVEWEVLELRHGVHPREPRGRHG